MSTLAENKKAHHEYEILEEFEAGMVLNGQEVKSIKEGRVSLQSSYIAIQKGDPYLLGVKIPPYQPQNISDDYKPERKRKLLLRQNQIEYLGGKNKKEGLTLVPLKVYTKRGLIKLKFGLAKGKKQEDRRKEIKDKEIQRQIERARKEHQGMS